MNSPIDIGALLVTVRRAAGVTQRNLGERVGVSQPQIARWEAAAYRSATLENVDAVARALEVDLPLPAPLAAESPASYVPARQTSAAERALASLGVSPEAIAAFCRLHGIRELALFGSAARGALSANSDVDILVTWAKPGRRRSVSMTQDIQTELEAIFRRPVDLVERASVERSENYLRRRRILEEAVTVFVAR